MSKPQVRINVEELDRLMKLDPLRERVWMYYKRREGADGKAFGKAQTIADWAGGYDPGSVRNARAWLQRNGWLTRNGKSKSGLPMFLAVIPELHLEASECHLEMTELSHTDDTSVISKLHQVSSGDETEVVTLKEQPESSYRKDPALTSGLVSKPVSSDDSLRSSSSCLMTSNTPNSNVGVIGDKAEQDQKQHQLLTAGEQAKVDYILNNSRLASLFGLQYFTTDHISLGLDIADSLKFHNRSVDWLCDLVGLWLREHKFWSKRVHSGTRGLKQLANHLIPDENGESEIKTQFDAHLAIKVGASRLMEETDPKRNGYLWQTPESAAYRTAAAGKGFNLEDIEPVRKGFDLEEA